MKNIFLKFFMALFAVGTVVSCAEHDEFPMIEKSMVHFINSAESAYYDTTTNNGNHEIKYGLTKAAEGSHTVELVFDPAKSTAILGTDFTIVKGTDNLNNGDITGEFIIDMTKAAATAGKKAVFTIESNSLETTSSKASVTVTFSLCPSDLAGTYSFSTVNFGSIPDLGTTVIPGPATGTVTITESTTVNGQYTVSDASFGAYLAMYGANTAASTGVKLIDECGKLSFSGPNQYGDTHMISNVVVNGSSLTFDWETSYGEYGTTTLTKADGNWPADLH